MNDKSNKLSSAPSMAKLTKLGGCILASSSLVVAPASAAVRNESGDAASLQSRIDSVKNSIALPNADGTEPEAQAMQWYNWFNAPWGNWNNFPNWGNWGNFYNF